MSLPNYYQLQHQLTFEIQENDMGHSEHDEADPMGEPFYEFALPKDEYGEMTFAKRLAPDRSQSPPTLSDPVPSGRSSSNRRHSTIDDTDGTFFLSQTW
jgi:MRG-binding protein